MESHSSSRFVIFDGHGLIYRAYHAFPPLSTSEGVLVNAVYGFTRILLTALNELQPEYVAVAFDHKLPTKRSEEYKEYKAHRPKMPDDLKAQIGLVKDVVTALNIPQFEIAGFEADDLIGTITQRLKTDRSLQTIVVTGDKDLLQLVDDTTHAWMPVRSAPPKKGLVEVEYDAEGVKEKMGVRPDQIPDLKALMGDASDNIPGVAGIGSKTAQTLITTFDTLEKLYERVDEVQGSAEKDVILKGAVLQKLVNGKENAFLSQKLARINRNIEELEFKLEPCQISNYDKDAVAELFEKLDFKSLIKLLPKDSFELGVQNALF